MNSIRLFWLITAIALLATSPLSELPAQTLLAADDPSEQPSADTPQATRYSASVEAKAEKILQEAGLRRSGRSLIANESAEIARAMTALSKQRRELTLEQKELDGLLAQVQQINDQIRNLETQDGELNLQLARVAGNDVASNNRIVALINANRTRVGQFRSQRTKTQELANQQRSELNSKEAAYAESVFQIRKDLNAMRASISEKLEAAQVKIAIQVMAANQGIPASISAEDILQTIELRLAKIEQEVFSESIPLEIERNGSLYVTVSVNNQPVRMIVDSGATLVTLPAEIAKALQIEIPTDAPLLRLVMANGDEISAKRVKLDSVRVGQFEAKEVSCAVLEPIASRADPMLGMSYLGEFKFEIDAAQKSLSMLRVETSP
ncbi:retropepsin-like aspartic protease family protein [Rhodopirellula sp. P2]|uniref:retropepsin-like aspartic protease family protein n=1 Tax=Rhodopirellula sp. P2 TaxID=2127060 RepID=UPI0023679C41|nr:TIGR02281 family clan AA aspartic protease [Rhodopirellula sp. P2]WDQ15552.1 TIGR02281 family clan AA aspartic protease [Rhodopirellula sp. P2]